MSLSETSPVNVQGRLRKHSSFWTEELEASVFVRDIVHNGYRFPFLATPAPVFRFNHQSALQNEQFVSEALDELVTGNCGLPQAECPLVCSPLSVVQSGKGKRRLVIDLRCLNPTSQSRSSNMKV